MAKCLTLRSIISRFYDTWALGRRLRADVKRAVAAIIDCRTSELGSYIECCDCGHITHVKYNSCRHRSCPQCSGGCRADWLEKISKQLLPCGHLHIIFTVPEELNILWRFNRELFAGKLLTAARQTLGTLLADKKYLGAEAFHLSSRRRPEGRVSRQASLPKEASCDCGRL